MDDDAVARVLQRAATAGVRVWNNHPFPILVDERGTRQADVEIRWTPALPATRLGVTHTEWSPATGLKVRSIELVTRSPGTGRAVDPRQIRLTAAHEMGHALGLPHSDDPRDLMYPENTATSLTAQDFRTLEVLYELDDGTRIVP
jgi:predicted Zn-dependent protease